MKGGKGKEFGKMTEHLRKSRNETISREYADNIIRSMTGSLIVVSPEGNIEGVNAATCALLGYEEKEIVGQPVGKIVAAEEEFKGSGIEDLIRKDSVQNVEKAYLSKDGRKIPVLFSGSVMRADDGKIQGIVCVSQDITERKQAEEMLRRLIRDTLNAQEAERERICLEVHDGVAQTLASAFQYLQAFDNTPDTQISQARHLTSKASTLVKQAIQEAREVINSLRPTVLSRLGLVPTLRQEINDLEKDTGWKIDFVADHIRPGEDIEIALYRIMHEALINVRKHTRTNHVSVELRLLDKEIVAQVRDWGVGFELKPSWSWASQRGTGLLSMYRRAKLIGGECHIESSPGQGTTVTVKVPVKEENEHGDHKGTGR